MNGMRSKPLLERLQHASHLPERHDCRDAYVALMMAGAIMTQLRNGAGYEDVRWQIQAFERLVTEGNPDHTCHTTIME